MRLPIWAKGKLPPAGMNEADMKLKLLPAAKALGKLGEMRLELQAGDGRIAFAGRLARPPAGEE